MQDLLNEKEFAPKYDPWKSIYRFYGIALLQLPVLIGLSEIFKKFLHEFYRTAELDLEDDRHIAVGAKAFEMKLGDPA